MLACVVRGLRVQAGADRADVHLAVDVAHGSTTQSHWREGIVLEVPDGRRRQLERSARHPRRRDVLCHVAFLQYFVLGAELPLPRKHLVDDAMRLLHIDRYAHLLLLMSADLADVHVRRILHELLLPFELLLLVADGLEELKDRWEVFLVDAFIGVCPMATASVPQILRVRLPNLEGLLLRLARAFLHDLHLLIRAGDWLARAKGLPRRALVLALGCLGLLLAAFVVAGPDQCLHVVALHFINLALALFSVCHVYDRIK